MLQGVVPSFLPPRAGTRRRLYGTLGVSKFTRRAAEPSRRGTVKRVCLTQSRDVVAVRWTALAQLPPPLVPRLFGISRSEKPFPGRKLRRVLAYRGVCGLP
jgi:hypothetical protein